ncbi:MAG: response regulator [Alphaproteobacteria bacterium]|nr:response regulator [Alphaproteobacteria bacterium]
MSTEIKHILVVDDDTRLRELLQKYLFSQGFHVSTAENTVLARQQIENLSFDLIVLDIMMPGEDGLSLARFIRQKSTVPILMLTAMGEAEDRINGLEHGADDYLTKPFDPRELVLRIRTILRRISLNENSVADIAKVVRIGNMIYETKKRILRNGDNEIRLTKVELDLLDILVNHMGQPVSRELLCQQSSEEAATTRAVDVQITRLRRKIEKDPRYPRYLQTVRGRGYLLQSD